MLCQAAEAQLSPPLLADHALGPLYSPAPYFRHSFICIEGKQRFVKTAVLAQTKLNNAVRNVVAQV